MERMSAAMDTVRIGYIGAGAFSSSYMFPQMPQQEVELVAVCDLIEERALDAQRKWGFQRAYTDFRRMCDHEKLEAVFCVGGPRVHHEVGLEILDRGLPLYVQKPPALTAAETEQMAQLAARRNVVCHVGFNIRSSPAVRRAKAMMGRPEFGETTLIIFRYGFVSGRTVEDAVIDQHCHAYDTTRYLAGDEVESVTAVWGEVADTREYVAALRFAGGTVATVNFTSEQGWREFIYFEVTGRNGALLTSHQLDLRYRQTRSRFDPQVQPDADYVWGPDTAVNHAQYQYLGYYDDVRDFVDAVRGRSEDSCPIASTIGTVALCQEVYRQLRAQGADAAAVEPS
jgi:myo-inositol 2-dehydrogenase/D-chiro-inositol 1-dehydrogenase